MSGKILIRIAIAALVSSLAPATGLLAEQDAQAPAKTTVPDDRAVDAGARLDHFRGPTDRSFIVQQTEDLLALVDAPSQPIDHLALNIQQPAESDLRELGKLTALPSLAMHACPVADAWLTHLKPLQALKDLRLSGVGDDGLDHVQALRRLQELRIDRSSVTDDGLVHLTKLPALRVLHLCESPITDRGIDQLAKMTSLRLLMLCDSEVSADGVRRLKHALPDCLVTAPAMDSGLSSVTPWWHRPAKRLGLLSLVVLALLVGNAIPPRRHWG